MENSLSTVNYSQTWRLINWKIAHRALPTALSLNRMGVYTTPNCHRCGVTDTLEHAMLACPFVDNFWNEIQAYVDKITNKMLTLPTQVKLFGKVKTKNDPLGSRTIDLVNWTLTLTRWAIYKSAVNYRVRSLTIQLDTLFRAMVKSHLRFQFKLYRSPSLISLHWLPVTHRIEFKIAMLVHKCIYGVAPQYLLDLIKINESSRYQLRSHRNILLLDNTYRTKKTLGDRAFENVAPEVWNRLPLEIRQCQSLNTFKVLLKTHLFKLAFY